MTFSVNELDPCITTCVHMLRIVTLLQVVDQDLSLGKHAAVIP